VDTLHYRWHATFMQTLRKIVLGRPRLFIAALAGIAMELALLLRPMSGLTRGLLAWDFACCVLLALAADLFTRERDMARDAEAQQEGEWTVFALTVGAVAASFAAILGEFSVSKEIPAAVRGMHVALVAGTLLVSWLTTHTIFALRYAHEYYSYRPGTTQIDGGLEFPSEPAPDYWDFFYFALVLGMTFQVSDVQITSRTLRRLGTAHGLLGFLFNTVILALSVNIGASLL